MFETTVRRTLTDDEVRDRLIRAAREYFGSWRYTDNELLTKFFFEFRTQKIKGIKALRTIAEYGTDECGLRYNRDLLEYALANEDKLCDRERELRQQVVRELRDLAVSTEIGWHATDIKAALRNILSTVGKLEQITRS